MWAEYAVTALHGLILTGQGRFFQDMMMVLFLRAWWAATVTLRACHVGGQIVCVAHVHFLDGSDVFEVAVNRG